MIATEPAYVVFERRYYIFEEFGPYSAIMNVLPTYFLVAAWPLAIGCVSFVYSCESLGFLAEVAQVAADYSQQGLSIFSTSGVVSSGS